MITKRVLYKRQMLVASGALGTLGGATNGHISLTPGSFLAFSLCLDSLAGPELPCAGYSSHSLSVPLSLPFLPTLPEKIVPLLLGQFPLVVMSLPL